MVDSFPLTAIAATEYWEESVVLIVEVSAQLAVLTVVSFVDEAELPPKLALLPPAAALEFPPEAVVAVVPPTSVSVLAAASPPVPLGLPPMAEEFFGIASSEPQPDRQTVNAAAKAAKDA